MSTVFRVTLLGFSADERQALASYFQLVARRPPYYLLVAGLDDGDFILADADHPPSVQLVWAVERLADTLFIGGRAPPAGAAAWMTRPIDALHVVRELDALVAQTLGTPQPFAPLPKPPVARTVLRPEPWGLAPPLEEANAPAPALLAVRTALVVDDSEIARHFLRGKLERWGLQVESAASSGQAITWLFRQRFDFLFLDVELGARSQLDGLGLCQLIRRKHPPAGGAPSMVVMVSSHQAEVDRVRGTLAGCDAYLGKPLVEADLDRLLRRQGLKPAAAAAGPLAD